MSRSVVIDANRIFSELIAANHRLRRTFATEPDTEFVCPKYVLVELFKHKERIVAATGLDEANLLARAEQAFEVFVTMDGNIEFQQDYARLRLAIVALRARSNRLRDTEPLMPKLLALLPELRPGAITSVE